MKEIAFLTVVYPGVEPYLPDFFASLNNQSCKDFDLIIYNDGLCGLDEKFHKLTDIRYRIFNVSGSPAKIREKAINGLKFDGFKYAIFGDGDDYFSENRVTDSLNLLKKNDIVMNDLDLVDDTGRITAKSYLSNRLINNQTIDFDFIVDKNIFGLSNTAINLDKIPHVSFTDDLVAVDWYFFTILLKNGLKAVFSNQSKTYYRQHDSNIVGLGKTLDERVYRNGLNIKKIHYRELSKIFKFYKGLYAKYQDKFLHADSFYKDCKQINNVEYPLWWELF